MISVLVAYRELVKHLLHIGDDGLIRSSCTSDASIEDLLKEVFTTKFIDELRNSISEPSTEDYLLTEKYREGSTFLVGVKVYYGAGDDGTEIINGVIFRRIYCDGRCRADFGDISFSSFADLSHSLEVKVEGDYAIFWIEIPKTADIAETAFIHYGDETKLVQFTLTRIMKEPRSSKVLLGGSKTNVCPKCGSKQPIETRGKVFFPNKTKAESDRANYRETRCQKCGHVWNKYQNKYQLKTGG